MRILITTDAVGGVWDHTRRLAQGLSDAHDVLLAIAGPVPSGLEPPAGVQTAHLPGPLEWMPDGPGHVPKIQAALQDIAKDFAADVVHANAFGHVLPGRPVVLTAHSTLHGWWRAVHGATVPPPEWDAYADVVRQAIADAALVVAPSRAMAEEIALYGRPASDVRIVHNGIPPAAGGPSGRRPFVLSGGRLWDEGKGFALLDKAAIDIPWPVRVTGSLHGPMGQEARFANLHHLGHIPRDRLDDLYAQAGIYANPSLYEPFGLGALEAAARGTPLVLPDIPSQRELWEGAAQFFTPGDPQSLAEALSRSAFDAAGRRRSGASAARRAQKYTHAAMVEGHLAAYQDAGALTCTT